MGVKHRQDLDEIARDPEGQNVWKTLDRAESYLPIDGSKVLGLRLKPQCGPLNFAEEFQA